MTSEKSNLFLEVVESPHFVDKTALMKVFQRQKAPILVTAPRFFGKSTTLSMLHTFYEISVDQNGAIVDKNTTRNHAAFVSLIDRERSSQTTIFEDAKWCEDQFGSLPVMHYSFENLTVANFDVFLDSFSQLIVETFQNYKYLLQSKRLSPIDKTLYSSYAESRKLGLEAIASSGRDLSRLLSIHFSHSCLVLMDELDAPILKTLRTPAKDEREVFSLLKEFTTQLLVNNTAVARAFLTGDTRLAKAVLPSTVVHWCFTEDEEISPFFGFTEDEMEYLIRDTELLQKDIRLYYDGYRGQNTSNWVYNPHSIVRLLQTNFSGVHWSGALPLEAFSDLYKKNEFVRGVFNSGSALKELKVELPRELAVEEQMFLLKEMLLHAKPVFSTDQMVTLVEFLYQLGYFTDKTIPRSTSDLYFVVITPNKEVSGIFTRFCNKTKV